MGRGGRGLPCTGGVAERWSSGGQAKTPEGQRSLSWPLADANLVQICVNQSYFLGCSCSSSGHLASTPHLALQIAFAPRCQSHLMLCTVFLLEVSLHWTPLPVSSSVPSCGSLPASLSIPLCERPFSASCTSLFPSSVPSWLGFPTFHPQACCPQHHFRV